MSILEQGFYNFNLIINNYEVDNKDLTFIEYSWYS